VIGAITAGLFSTGTTPSTNSYESIATVTVGAGGSSAINFTSIPSTFKHLQIRFICRGTGGSGGAPYYIQVGNGSADTAANYSNHQLFGDGSTTTASANSGSTANCIIQNWGGFMTYTNTDVPSSFGAAIVDILDYANTSKYKTARALEGREGNGGSPAGRVGLESGSWRSTSAIDTIKITTDATYGVNFAQYSQFALYGIKG